MPDLESLLPKLKRVDGTQLDDSDKSNLRDFFAQFTNESDAELERKRGIMRNRLRVNRERTVLFAVLDGETTPVMATPHLDWTKPHLDQAKHDILTAIVQDRMRAKLLPGSAKKDEILEIKPGWGGVRLDVKAAWRRIFKRKALP